MRKKTEIASVAFDGNISDLLKMDPATAALIDELHEWRKSSEKSLANVIIGPIYKDGKKVGDGMYRIGPDGKKYSVSGFLLGE